MEFARLARFARFSTQKLDFRRRSRPRELAHRSQDDVSLNKLPQIRTGKSYMAQDHFCTLPDPQKPCFRGAAPVEEAVFQMCAWGPFAVYIYIYIQDFNGSLRFAAEALVH